ncbi:hypothetical protein FAF44_03410 [Nonomuraea sp. MG754425]|uniref:hypothetical protein n=1 Tax=Nonomuraea sp. MG754425 TaxID=2570319 RepID=UPI001F379F5C|nr:hypothetical protein [Nonomuraea sp. MG754425]MCF6467462.1 hypothetical protein [Nonomuraea sp. MG754425]
MPIPRVLAAIGPDSLGELLTEIALEHWPAAAVGDVLPALHVLDPEEADEPAVAIALDRAGSWAGLLSLTGRELVDQPFIQARPVLSTLFSAVLVRLAHPRGADAPAAPRPAASAASAASAEPVVVAEPAAAVEPVVVAEPVEPVAPATPVAPVAQEPVERSRAADEPEPAAAGPEGEEAGAEEAPEPVAAQHAAEAAEEPAPHVEDEPVVRIVHVLDEEIEDVPAPQETGEPQADARFREEAPEEAAAEQQDAAAVDNDGPVTGADEPEAAERAEDAVTPEAGSVPDSPEPVPAPADEPAVQEAQPLQAQPLQAQPLQAESHEPESYEPEIAHGAGDTDGPRTEDELEDDEPGAGQEPAAAKELPELIEAAFAGLDDKTWAVAQNRVFTDQPSAVDQLAKLFAVPAAEISATEGELRARLDRWLASDEAAPYRAHLEDLVKTLGPAAPKEELIGAADWHNREIRALEVPAWQFVLATLAPPPQESPPPLPQRKPNKNQSQPPAELVGSAFGPAQTPPQFQAFTPTAPPAPQEANGEQDQPYQPLKDVSQTRCCFRQPDGRWWLRIDVTAEQLAGGEAALPTGFASYLGLSPGESRTVRSAAGELTMVWHGTPSLQSIERLLMDVGAREGGHLFLTLSDEGVLRARHLPVAAQGAEKITKALRLVGYTAPGGTRDQAARVIATRIGMSGPTPLPELLGKLRERGDRDLLELLD